MVYGRMCVACIAIFICLPGACAWEKADTSKIVVIEKVATFYQSGCVMLLHSRERVIDDHYRISHFFKKLAINVESFFTVGAININEFYWIHGEKQKEIKCNNPLIITIHLDNATRQELAEMTNKMVLPSNVFWLFFIDEHIHEFFEGIHTPFNLQIMIASRINDEHFHFQEIYRVAKNKPLRHPRLGQWTMENGLQISRDIKYNRRYNLEGIVMRTGTTENEPIHWSEKTPNGEMVLKGYFPAVWKQLEEILNFTSVHFPSVDNVTGIPEENGTWSGLVGMLQRKEIDVAVSEFIMDEQRSHVVEFTRPLLKSSYQIFFQNLGNNFNWNAILSPFQTEIWMTIFLWILVAAVFFSSCHSQCLEHRLEWNTRKEDFNLLNSIFFFTKALCNQGHPFVPTNVSCRIIYISAYVVTAVLVPSYSAALISYLTSKTPRRPFDSLPGLMKVGTYKLQTNAKTAEYTYFSNSTNVFLKKVYWTLMAKIPEHELPLNTKEALKKVCQDPYLAHFGDMAVAKSYLQSINNDESNNCNLMHLSQPISTIYSCMALTRKNPYKEVINHILQKMEDSGIVDDLLDRHVPSTKIFKGSNWSEVEGNDVIPMFILLLVGSGLAIVFLIIEKLAIRLSVEKTSKWRQSKNNQQKIFFKRISTDQRDLNMMRL